MDGLATGKRPSVIRENTLQTCVGDGFSGATGDRTGLRQTANPLFSGSFLAENVCWGAQRGASLAPERFFWESTPKPVNNHAITAAWQVDSGVDTLDSGVQLEATGPRIRGPARKPDHPSMGKFA